MTYHRIIHTVRTEFVIEAMTIEDAWEIAEAIRFSESHPNIVLTTYELDVQPSAKNHEEVQLDNLAQLFLDFTKEVEDDLLRENSADSQSIGPPFVEVGE